MNESFTEFCYPEQLTYYICWDKHCRGKAEYLNKIKQINKRVKFKKVKHKKTSPKEINASNEPQYNH